MQTEQACSQWPQDGSLFMVNSSMVSLLLLGFDFRVKKLGVGQDWEQGFDQGP